jgi:hypothetical protein
VKSSPGTAPALAPATALGGALRILPGTAQPIQGGRPVLSATALQALTQGVPVAAYAGRMALLFSLCGTAHRITARAAVQAAQQARPGPLPADDLHPEDDALLAAWTAREHLQRLALELPQRLPVAGAIADAAWLRGHPLQTLPGEATAADLPTLRAALAALRPWLEAQVLGGAAAAWQQAWAHDATTSPSPAHSALQAWAAGRPQPAQRWLHAAAGAGRRALPCRALPAAQCEPDALHTLAQRLFADPAFAQQPTWQGEPAETGCWTRFGRSHAGPDPHNAWMRWQYRIAELVALAADGGPRVLARGALALGDGLGLAWTEMSRGLLVHAVRLKDHSALVDQGRVLAPTEWNFHPAGGLARALANPGCADDEARAAVAALDPCVEALIAAPAGVHGHA